MKVGLRILGDQAIVFGTDDFGAALFPDVGPGGYERLHALAEERREARGYRTEAVFKGLNPFLGASGANLRSLLPDGYVVVEQCLPKQDAGLYLYDPKGIQIAGPFLDSEGIVAASSLHRR